MSDDVEESAVSIAVKGIGSVGQSNLDVNRVIGRFLTLSGQLNSSYRADAVDPEGAGAEPLHFLQRAVSRRECDAGQNTGDHLINCKQI